MLLAEYNGEESRPGRTEPMTKSLKLISATLVSFVVFGLINHASLASSENQAVKAVFWHYPPGLSNCCGVVEEYSSGWISGPELDFVFSGPWRDLIRNVFKQLGQDVQWKRIPFGEALDSVSKGDIDVIPHLFFTEARAQFVWFVGPIEVEDGYVNFLLNKKIHGDITKVEDLFDLILANEINSATGPGIDNNPKIRIDRFGSRLKALTAVISREADVLVDTNLERLLEMRTTSRATQLTVATYRYPFTIKAYLGLSRKSFKKEEAMKIDKLVENMFDDGTVALIYKSYELKIPTYKRQFSRLGHARKTTHMSTKE